MGCLTKGRERHLPVFRSGLLARAQSLLGCLMPYPSAWWCPFFSLLQPGTFLSDRLLWAIYHFLLIVCAIIKVFCVFGCACAMGTKASLLNRGSLVSAVLCSSWPMSIAVQIFTGLLGLDHCIWLYTYMADRVWTPVIRLVRHLFICWAIFPALNLFYSWDGIILCVLICLDILL